MNKDHAEHLLSAHAFLSVAMTPGGDVICGIRAVPSSPETWGRMLSDVMQQAALVYASQGMDSEEATRLMLKGFHAGTQKPADISVVSFPTDCIGDES